MICGIDEAGRGCIAGPLCIAGCILKAEISGLKDSKKLSQKKREELFEIIKENSFYKILEFSNLQIDELGLSVCLKIGLENLVNFFKNFNCEIVFDGNCNFGVFGFQTLIKADDKIKEVSAASILAKVTRDKKMMEFDAKFPQYGFEKHKGYGSKFHVEMVKKFGLSPCHRKSFKIKSLESTLFD